MVVLLNDRLELVGSVVKVGGKVGGAGCGRPREGWKGKGQARLPSRNAGVDRSARERVRRVQRERKPSASPLSD